MSSNTNLGNTPVNQGYVQLIHTGETGGIDGTLRTLYDGDGTAADLQIASDKVKVSTELFIGTKTLTEFIQDTVGTMFTTGNSLTNVTVTYDDANNNIDLNASGEVTLAGSQTLTNKTLTSPVINTGVSGTAVLDEDTMSSNSDSKLATQQSIKAYVDTEVAGIVNSAPSALDTLDELAAALGDDANFATTTATSLGEKLVKASNLSDLTNTTTARSNLGLGSLAQLSSVAFSNIAAAAVQTSGESFSDNDTTLMTSAAIQDKIESFGFTTNTGTVDTSGSPVDNDFAKFTDANTIEGRSASEMRSDLNVEDGADVTDATNVTAAGALMDSEVTNLSFVKGLTSGISDGNVLVANSNVANDDFLRIDGTSVEGRTASEVKSDLGLGSLAELSSVSFSNISGSAIQTSAEIGSSFGDNDTTLLTAAAVNDRIESFGYTTNTGDMTGVSITANDPLDISQSNTTSGNYSATISLDATEFQGYLTDKTDNNLGADELLIIDSGDTTLKRKAINEIRLTTFDSTGFSAGAVSAVANGADNRIATFSSSDALNGESTLTWNGSDYLDITSADGAEGGVRLNKSTMDGDHIRYHISHRDDNQTLIIYSYDGTTFRNWITLDEPNALLKLGSNSSALSSFNSDGDLDMHGDIEITATKKLYFDGGSHTYIHEQADDILEFVVGNDILMKLTEAGSGIEFPQDSHPLKIGAGSDLQLNHNGADSFVENYTGALNIINNTDDGDIIFKSDNGSGGTTAYLTLDGSATLVNFDKASRHMDNTKLYLGAGLDLELYHTGSDSYIANTTGDLYIQNEVDDKDIIFRSDDGSGGVTPYLTLDGSAESIEIAKKMQFPASHTADKIVMYSGGNEKIGTEANTLLFTGANHVFHDTSNNDMFKITSSGVYVDDISGLSNGTNRLVLDDDTRSGLANGVSLTGVNTVYICCDETNNGTGEIQFLKGTDNDLDAGTAVQMARIDNNSIFYIDDIHSMANNNNRLILDDDTNSSQANGVSLTGANHVYICPDETNNGTGDVRVIKGTDNDLDSGTAAELFRITNAGKVGIMEDSIDANLHITGSPVVVKLERAGQRAMRFGTPDNSAKFIFADSDDLKSNIAIEIDSSRDVKITESVGIGVAANGTAGRLDCSNDVVAFASSDKRLKENIKPLDNALDKINKINGVEFDWKKLTEKEKETIHGNTGHDVGVIAQEIEEVLPEVVTTRDSGYKAVKYEKIVPLLIEAIKELKQEIEDLKK